MSSKFELVSNFKPCGDQPRAIRELGRSLLAGNRYATLLGVTGSGKTFTLANVFANLNKPALVISHNKTLAAQLYSEFKEFFPHNAVEYFVSYYDYYQPEAYIPSTDTYIEKDSSINERLDRLRLSATTSLMSRRDVIIVASVSCIYNLGSPEEYRGHLLVLELGGAISRDELIARLIQIQYERNDYEFKRGRIRVRGGTVEIFPSYSEKALRVELEADTIGKISIFDPVSSKTISNLEKTAVYPAKHFVVPEEKSNRRFLRSKQSCPRNWIN
jgi:excinuclease ABC subunit B